MSKYQYDEYKNTINYYKYLNETFGNINDLFVDKSENYYLMGLILTKMLRMGNVISQDFLKNINDKIGGNSKYIYLVVFNVIKNNNKQILVYSYVQYNKVFVELLYVYCMFQQKGLFRHPLTTNRYFIIDEEIVNKISYLEPFKEKLSKKVFYTDYPSLDKKNNWDILKFLNVESNGELRHINYKKMGELIHNLISKNQAEI